MGKACSLSLAKRYEIIWVISIETSRSSDSGIVPWDETRKPIRGEAKFGRPVEALSQVDGIAQIYFSGIDLIVPNIEPRELCRAVERRKGALDGVETTRDVDSADACLLYTSPSPRDS